MYGYAKAEGESPVTPGGSMRYWLRGIILCFLSACSGGDGVSIGDGQDADPVIVDFPIAYVRAPVPIDDEGELDEQDLRENRPAPIL